MSMHIDGMTMLRHLIREVTLGPRLAELPIEGSRRGTLVMNDAAHDVLAQFLMRAQHVSRAQRERILGGQEGVPNEWVPKLVAAGAERKLHQAKQKRPAATRQSSSDQLHAFVKAVERIVKKDWRGAWADWSADQLFDDPDTDLDIDSFAFDMADSLLAQHPELTQHASQAGINSWRAKQIVADTLAAAW